MKILGLDIGRKRVGVAIADTISKTIVSSTYINTPQGEALRQLIIMIEENGYRLVVVGLPLDELGNDTTESLFVRNFCRRLENRTKIQIEFIDEWGTSMEAEQRLKNKGLNIRTSREKGLIDAESASIILGLYLQKHKS